MEVYVIEWQGDHENYVAGVATSVGAAVELLKALHPPPYVVEWDDDPVANGHGVWDFGGNFEAVAGKSTKHRSRWRISLFELVLSGSI